MNSITSLLIKGLDNLHIGEEQCFAEGLGLDNWNTDDRKELRKSILQLFTAKPSNTTTAKPPTKPPAKPSNTTTTKPSTAKSKVAVDEYTRDELLKMQKKDLIVCAKNIGAKKTSGTKEIIAESILEAQAEAEADAASSVEVSEAEESDAETEVPEDEDDEEILEDDE